MRTLFSEILEFGHLNGHFQPENELLSIDAFDQAEELLSVFSSSHPRVCHLSTRRQVNVAVEKQRNKLVVDM